MLEGRALQSAVDDTPSGGVTEKEKKQKPIFKPAPPIPALKEDPEKA